MFQEVSFSSVLHTKKLRHRMTYINLNSITRVGQIQDLSLSPCSFSWACCLLNRVHVAAWGEADFQLVEQAHHELGVGSDAVVQADHVCSVI